MLFSSKRRAIPALILCFTLVALSAVAHEGLDLGWSFAVPERLVVMVLTGLLLIGVSDSAIHGLLWLALRERYLSRYRALLQTYGRQSALAILAGSFLAACEELFFRGVLLEGIMRAPQTGPIPAILISSIAFALLHLIPQRTLAIFIIWAFWEGMLLGVVYMWSGSLLVVMLVHSLHDMTGFTLFAIQRSTGWLMGQDYYVAQRGIEGQ